MNKALGPVVSKALALALLLVFGAAIYLLGVRPVFEAHDDLDEQTAVAAERLARLGAVAGRSGSLREALDRLETLSAESRGYFSGTSANLLVAELQAEMKAITEEAGGKLTSFQVLPEKAAEPFAQVALRLTVEGDMEALQSFLYRLETWQPVLFVDHLDIQKQQARRLRVRLDQDSPDALVARLDVVGYLQAEDP